MKKIAITVTETKSNWVISLSINGEMINTLTTNRKSKRILKKRVDQIVCVLTKDEGTGKNGESWRDIR